MSVIVSNLLPDSTHFTVSPDVEPGAAQPALLEVLLVFVLDGARQPASTAAFPIKERPYRADITEPHRQPVCFRFVNGLGKILPWVQVEGAAVERRTPWATAELVHYNLLPIVVMPFSV
jgi:hypothetical protein